MIGLADEMFPTHYLSLKSFSFFYCYSPKDLVELFLSIEQIHILYNVDLFEVLLNFLFVFYET